MLQFGSLKHSTILCQPARHFATESKVKDAAYQYLQRSKVPTMHFQKSLPRLPIPPLKKTCERYLAAQRPLLNAESYKHVEYQTNNFANGVGVDLDKQLRKVDSNNKHTNYISKLWFETYLKDRIPLPINYNPLLVWHNDPKSEQNDQAVRATNLIVSSLRFMNSIRAGLLEPEVFHMNPQKTDTDLYRKVMRFTPSPLAWIGSYALFKAFPLDMSQYMGLFGSSRVPEMGMDRIVNDRKSKHITVQRRGHFYSFDVLDADGNLLEAAQIYGRLKYILSDSRPAAEFPVGILTTADRDVWASQRHHLSQVGNDKIMKTIDSSVFNVNLDDDLMGEDKVKILRNFLHADGKNRWFDKSFSLIVTGDGVSGVNFEHSWGDGVAVLRYFQDVFREVNSSAFVTPSTTCNEHISDTTVSKLDFNIDEKIQENITMACKAYKDWCSSLGVDYLLHDGLGRNTCKIYKLSPDSVIQLAFQAAYHLMTEKFVGTYESCSTAAFKHGRTETMRPCTMETKKFCEALHSGGYSTGELAAMIANCSKTHSELTKNAAMGQGFDRHLFALKNLAESKKLPSPGIFGDAEYKMLNTSILSTSTLSSPAVMAGGFGPVVKNGFGIGYSVMQDSLGAVVTSYPGHSDGTEFVRALKKSLDDIENIIKAAGTSRA